MGSMSPRRKTRRAPTTSSTPTRSTIERGISPDTIRLLEEMGHKVVLSKAMGSANTIVRAPDGELTGRVGFAPAGNAGGRILIDYR